MKFLNGDRAKDSAGNQWTIWSSQLIQGKDGLSEHCLCYCEGGAVTVFPADALEKVEEE